MDGILLVDKPAGISSFGAVGRVRWLIKQATGQKIKIGHTGTLDPAASGLLILVLGKYTKRAGQFSKLDKTYEAELTLGQTSSTGDAEGELTIVDGQKPEKVALEAVLGHFEGEITQTPPIYSAIKVNGQRAYKMARQGLTPKMEPRKVKVYSIKLTDYTYPKVKLATEVSSGTYIRALAEDIGQQLDTGAYLSSLRRTQVGKFSINDSLELESLTFDRLTKGLSNHL